MNDRPQIQPDPVRMGEHSSEHSLSGQTIDPASATTVVGDYELLAEIARGGMGVVYQARQRSLDRFVALKLILAGTLADESEVDRFKAEAKAAARLDHPNIVPVYDIGTHERQYFFSMGLVDGLSLAARLKTSGPLPPLFAASLMAKVARAVAYAHDVGVVHRDLKPGNVLLDSADHPWVTDFGLAKRVDESAGLTATGQVMGTPAYMPPEQAAGETDRIGPLADVYSLGATLYAALTGQPPFSGGTIHELLMQVAEDPPRPPSERNPAVTPDLDAVCLRCLAKHPADRYPLRPPWPRISSASLAASGSLLKVSPTAEKATSRSRWCRSARRGGCRGLAGDGGQTRRRSVEGARRSSAGDHQQGRPHPPAGAHRHGPGSG
ncbi:MAG: serine/threonine-protein kinase [Gemmataceae bacterium]